MSRIPALAPESAAPETKALFAAVKGKLGSVPNLFRVLGNAPAALKGYLNFSEALSGASLDAKTREAVALTVAGANSCAYCAAAHSFISKSLKVDDGEIGLRLKGRSADAKTQAVLTFARQIVEKRGLVSDADVSAARAAGLDDRAVTEIVAIVALNIFTNYVNHVAETDVDFPKVSLAA
jgi:uncharacterized peroxidase-related enzyme